LPSDGAANRLLALLAPQERETVRAQLEELPLKLGQVLQQSAQPITHVYFPTRGVVSLVIEPKNGHSAEVATIGKDGMVGAALFLGVDRTPIKAFVQIPGEALRMRAEAFHNALGAQPTLRPAVARFMQALFAQVAQSVVCNGVHSVQERMCRWLLMTHDLVDGDELPLTQEFLAEMLAVRRPTVTVIAGTLQKAGLIEYRRGRIRVLERRALEDASCDCYAAVRAEIDRLLPAA
jgi:CRP-like cAMP-binding protein